MKFGTAMAARIPMMATTIINSMSVKPISRFLTWVRCMNMVVPPFQIVWGYMGTYSLWVASPGSLADSSAITSFFYQSPENDTLYDVGLVHRAYELKYCIESHLWIASWMRCAPPHIKIQQYTPSSYCLMIPSGVIIRVSPGVPTG